MRYFILLILVLAGFMEMMKCQVLQSSVVADQPIYPGEEITFTCKIQSPVIAWTSEEFIGPGGAQLVLSSFYSPGVVRRSMIHPNTSAEIVEVFNNDTNHLLISELRIMTSLPQNASVSCIDVGNGYHSTYPFVVNDLPDPIVSCSIPQNGSACPDEDLIFTCVASDSTILAWKSDEYIGTGGVQILFSDSDSPGTVKRSPQNTNTVAMLLDKTYERGVPTLRCQLNITVSPAITQEYHHSVICINEALGTDETFSFRKKDTCGATTDHLLVTIGKSGSSNFQAIWSIVISALLVMIATFE